MSFWTGLEAFTGHQPGAFTGMTMKGLFDKDMWDRLPRTWSGQRTPVGATESARQLDIRTGRAGEPMMTNWASRGAENVLLPGSDRARVNKAMAFSSPPQPEGALAGPPRFPQMRPYVRQNVQSIPVPSWTPPRTQAEMVQEIGPYYGMGEPYSGWGGYLGSAKNAHMGMGASGYRVPPTPQYDSTMQQMADMTTVKTITDDNTPNKITQTIKQQVPASPTNTLMNMGSRALSKVVNPVGNYIDLWGDTLNKLRRKRYEDAMRARGGY